jgi:hypothetical protein
MARTHAIRTEAADTLMGDVDWGTMYRAFHRFTSPATASKILLSCLPELSQHSHETSTCTIQDARLKTFVKSSSKIKSTLSACYQLTTSAPLTNQRSQRFIYLKAFLDGRSAETFHRLTHRSADSECAQAVIHVPEYDAIIWRFPDDPALPHLHQLIDLTAVKRHLPAEGLSRIGMSRTPRVLESHVVNYRPEIRCTNRYELHDPIQNRTYQLFGKTFHNGDGRSLNQRLDYFWNRSLTNPDAMAVARPLGYSEQTHTVWQLGVLGTPLLQILNSSNYEQYSRAISKGLASLHTSDAADLLAHSPADHIAEIHKKLAKLSDAGPLLSRRLHALGDELERIAPQPSAIPFCPIHWDFHIEQLLASQEQVIFCDLDELIIGDPVQDLANFMVDLHFRNIDKQLIRLITADLYYAYRQQVTWSVPIDRLAWHARLQFINKAYRHYLRFAPGFEDTVERILQLAERGFSL